MTEIISMTLEEAWEDYTRKEFPKMSIQRDPRTDPRAGDVLQKLDKHSSIVWRRVDSVKLWPSGVSSDILYTQGPSNRRGDIFLCNWVKWAADAEVITRGPE